MGGWVGCEEAVRDSQSTQHGTGRAAATHRPLINAQVTRKSGKQRRAKGVRDDECTNGNFLLKDLDHCALIVRAAESTACGAGREGRRA